MNPKEVDDVVDRIRELTGGVDYALETTGVPAVAEQATDTLTQFGTLGIIGAPPLGTRASYDVNDHISGGRSITGIVQGDPDPQQFTPDLIELYRQGKFPFDELVTYCGFEDIEQAVEDSESGETIKPVLRVGDA
ncbi:zinc-binding dehydrogenase [Halorarum salinum]|uniref:zinc-binding dehydrogenase n=1 Tax=Halorarum salinum TaxID=2743089 RepID=UPI001FE370E0|nr:zinc-binding dehydrogenase [Halobaculum salinum]